MPALTGISSAPRQVSYRTSTELTAGAEFQAVVEYAPIEKTPFKVKAKKDAREGTIDDGELERGR